jgi:hypothetical protein
MDNSTVVGDNVSVFSVPPKERPATPCPPLNPRPYVTSRTDLPVGAAVGRLLYEDAESGDVSRDDPRVYAWVHAVGHV